MLTVTKALLSVTIILQLSSCTPSPPYEIKSPCVAIEPSEPTAFTPCIRRPVNSNKFII